PSSRKPPNSSVYELITHCSELSVKFRSVWIVGSATFTTVASSTTMNWARQTIASTSQGLWVRSCRCVTVLCMVGVPLESGIIGTMVPDHYTERGFRLSND